MHSGTTSDVFLRENLEWLGLASNWSKFTATAALGVIHKGHFQEGMNILGPYLPQANGNDSGIPGAAYSEGGALYALGLIHAGCGSGRQVEGYLKDALKASTVEVVQHGAALGLGVAGMGGKSAEAFEELKSVLYGDLAVAGEAAGYAMGLIMLGTGDATAADEMLVYARETQHEKIIRGLAIGLAFIYYGRQEQADATIKELLAEKVGLSKKYNLVFLTHNNHCRTLSSDMVVFTLWPLLMLVLLTMTLSASSSTLPSQTLPTMSEGLQSPHSPSSCSRIPLPSHVLSNCSVRATTPTSEVVPPLLWVSLVRVPVSRMLWRYSNP